MQLDITRPSDLAIALLDQQCQRLTGFVNVHREQLAKATRAIETCQPSINVPSDGALPPPLGKVSGNIVAHTVMASRAHGPLESNSS
jgi:hypothetical protein